MNRVLAEYSAPETRVILFANDTALHFYPRFGFRPVEQKRFVLTRDRVPGSGVRIMDLIPPAYAAILLRARPRGTSKSAEM